MRPVQDVVSRSRFGAALDATRFVMDAPRRRERELRLLDERLSRGDLDAAVTLADVNLGDDTPLPIAGLVDVWPALYPSFEAGYTFDPAADPLAAVGAPDGRPARPDRILPRCDPGRLVPVELQRFGDRPRYVSDRFGLTALLIST